MRVGSLSDTPRIRKAHANSAEGRHWQEFAKQLRRSLSAAADDAPALAQQRSRQLDSGDAVDDDKKQTAFFTAVDSGKYVKPSQKTHLAPQALKNHRGTERGQRHKAFKVTERS